MKANWKHPPRARRWPAGCPGMGAAATALRLRHVVKGISPVKPAHPGVPAPRRLIDPRGGQQRVQHSLPNHSQETQEKVVAPAYKTPEEDRARRLQLLLGTFGIWKGRPDLPQDGLEYQLEMRAEWD